MIVLLYGILVFAVLADLVTHKIPNALIIVALVISLLEIVIRNGLNLFFYKLFQMIVIFSICYILYLLSAVGAGDVKLMVVISLYYSLKITIQILLISMITFSIVGIIHLLISSKINHVQERDKGGLADLFIWNKDFDLFENYQNALIRLKVLSIRNKKEIKEKFKKGKVTKLVFSPFIMLAVMLVELGLIK